MLYIATERFDLGQAQIAPILHFTQVAVAAGAAVVDDYAVKIDASVQAEVCLSKRLVLINLIRQHICGAGT